MKKSFCQVPLCLSAAAGSDALARRQGNEARGEKNSSFADGRMEFSFDLVPNLWLFKEWMGYKWYNDMMIYR